MKKLRTACQVPGRPNHYLPGEDDQGGVNHSRNLYCKCLKSFYASNRPSLKPELLWRNIPPEIFQRGRRCKGVGEF